MKLSLHRWLGGWLLGVVIVASAVGCAGRNGNRLFTSHRVPPAEAQSPQYVGGRLLGVPSGVRQASAEMPVEGEPALQDPRARQRGGFYAPAGRNCFT